VSLIGVGSTVRPPDGSLERCGHLIDEGDVYEASRDVDDAMALGLENSDLRALGSTSNGQAGSMSKPGGFASSERRDGDAVSPSNSLEYIEHLGGVVRATQVRAARAGGLMRALELHGRTEARPCSAAC
jgi:hypothetical protein